MYLSYPKGLLQSAIVCNILALRHPAIHVHAHLLDLVPRVLVNYALGALTERANRFVVPPLHHIAIFVELTTWKM